MKAEIKNQFQFEMKKEKIYMINIIKFPVKSLKFIPFEQFVLNFVFISDN